MTSSLGDWHELARKHLEGWRSAGVHWLPRSSSQLPAASELPSSSELLNEIPALSEVAPDVPPEPEVLPGQLELPLHSNLAPGWSTPESRRQALLLLSEGIRTCQRCPELSATRTQTVFGVGAVDPDICFVGEAPGADEDAQGEPFVGPAGQLLTRIIAAMGLKREEVYICNILKCRPPGNRVPHAVEAGHCREFLERQLELVRPKHICALGSTAAHYLLDVATPVGKLRGRFHKYQHIPLLVTYHPSYLLRVNSKEEERQKKSLVWEDMKLLLTKMGRPIPTPR